MSNTFSDIATIHSGMYAKPILMGEIKYLQSRHFDRNRQFDTTIQSDLNFDTKLEKHLLRPGDVIVAAKGYDHFAIQYNPEIGPAVASTVFLVIRPKSKTVLPEYLAWFLNHPHTQKNLTSTSKGSNLPSITKVELEKIVLPIPSIEVQQTILNIHSLRQKEIEIKSKIEELKELSIQYQIINAIK